MTPGPSRQHGDAQLLKALADDGFAGPRYTRFAEELARYGISVLQGWMSTGWVFALTARLGFPLYPTEREQAELAGNHELRMDLASMTVAQTLPRFRAEALVGGGWKPTGGAGLTTYFMGACMRVFPNEYRSHCAAQRRWDRASEQATAWGEPRGEDAAIGVALGDVRLEDILRSLEPRLKAVLLLTAQDYSHAEIAEILGFPSAKAVEGVLYRLRQKAKKGREGEGDGKHH